MLPFGILRNSHRCYRLNDLWHINMFKGEINEFFTLQGINSPNKLS